MSTPPGASFSYRDGMRSAVPVAIAVGLFAASFGFLARTAGFGAVATVVMSATTFAGSAQLAAVSIIAAGGAVPAAVLAAVMLNARYAPIGLSVSSVLRGPAWRRLLDAQLVVDESWALSRRDGRFHRELLVGAGATLYVAWLAGTVLGVLGGRLVSDPARLGLDAAFPALYLALLWPQLRRGLPIATALLGVTIALALIPWAPPGIPVVGACAACALGLLPRR